MKIDGGKGGARGERLLARFAKIYVLGIFRMNAPGVRNSSYTLERVTTMLKTLFRVAPRRLVSSLRFSEFSPSTSSPLPEFSPPHPTPSVSRTRQWPDETNTRFLLFSTRARILYFSFFLSFLFSKANLVVSRFASRVQSEERKGIKVDGYRSLDLIPFARYTCG